MEALIHDLRYAVRSFGKDYRFSWLVVLVLAVGVGTAAVIFSVIYNGALNPFPYSKPDGLVRFYIHDLDRADDRGSDALSWPEFLDFRQQNQSFEDLIGLSNADALYTRGKTTDQLSVVTLTANAFQLLGVNPYLGRSIILADGEKGAPPVVALNYNAWKEKFNSDPTVVGSSLTLNGRPYTVIAVMPRRFQLEGGDAWIPLSFSRDETAVVGAGDNNTAEPLYVTTIGRLKPGVSVRSTEAALFAVAKHLATVYPDEYPKRFSVVVLTMADAALRDFHTKFYMLVSAIAMLLLIATSTVATLLLAKTTVRSGEIAIRVSLGASHAQIIRQLFAESLVLAAASAVLGSLFAYGGIRWLSVARPAHLWFPDEAVIALNSIVLLFVLGTSTIIAVLSGIAPAIHLLRPGLLGTTVRSGRSSGSPPWLGNLRGALVILEVALSIVLLVGAGLFARSFFALTKVELGFNTRNVVLGVLTAPKGRYDSAVEKKIYFQEVLRRVGALRGVASVAETTTLPPYPQFTSKVEFAGQTHGQYLKSELDMSSEGIFRTLGLHLLNGRLLSEADVEAARSVVVVNQTFVRDFFGEENAVGRAIKFDLLDELPQTVRGASFEIIGVIADVKNHGPQDPVSPEAYIPYSVSGFGDRAIIVRTTTNPDMVLPAIREQIQSVDDSVALLKARSLESSLQDFSYALPRFGASSLGIFATIGLGLVIVGVFSLMAYAVSLRTHEIAVRMAVGAQQWDIIQLVVRQGGFLLMTGIVVGLIASLGLTRFISAEIWGVSPVDPLTIGTVVFIVAGFGLLACLIPARRSTGVDPTIALRHE
jgi:putative ABC transport system permease protein